MPRLTFPIAADGLRLPVYVGLNAATIQAIHARGLPVPSPVTGRGLVDPGSTLTAVVPRLLTAIEATSVSTVSTTTAAGSARIPVYQISLTIFDTALPPADILHRDTWTVTGLPHDLPDVDVLIGLDLIRELVLTVDGPAGQFALSF